MHIRDVIGNEIMNNVAEHPNNELMAKTDLWPKKKLWDLLKQVADPEIPVISIVDLGIVKEINIENGNVEILITPTYSGCPAIEAIEDDIKSILTLNGYQHVDIKRKLSPAWSTDHISKQGKEKLLAYGIAPPEQCSNGTNNVKKLQFQVCCPQCNSLKTEMLSEFGSTACKALYRCQECLEPFDYFKPL